MRDACAYLSRRNIKQFCPLQDCKYFCLDLYKKNIKKSDKKDIPFEPVKVLCSEKLVLRSGKGLNILDRDKLCKDRQVLNSIE